MIHIALCKEVFSDIGAVPKFLEKKKMMCYSHPKGITLI